MFENMPLLANRPNYVVSATQSITLPKHGKFTFDPDIYGEVWAAYAEYPESTLRAVVAQFAYDSVRDVEAMSRMEYVAMLAEFETNRLIEEQGN